MHQTILSGAHTPLTGVSTSYLYCSIPMVLSLLLPFSLLGGLLPLLISSVISLHLDPVTWDYSAPSNRAASFSSILSQSYWMYSNTLFFFFFSSATLCLSTSSLAFSSTSLFAFWAVCSAQCNFTASSSWTRSHYSSLCLCCISCYCFSKISVLFCEVLEWVEKDMMVQKQEWKKLSFPFMYC